VTHLVVFDIDGTLVDSTGFDSSLYVDALRDVLEYEASFDWSAFPHVTDAGLLDECMRRRGLSDPDASLRREFQARFIESVRTYIDANPGQVREIPGARAMFDSLRRLPGLQVAIATGGWHETALMKLAAAGFEVGATPMATSSDHHDRREIMRLAERRACGELPPRRRTYFGDGAWDQQACHSLGWEFIAIGGRLDHVPAFSSFLNAAAIRRCLGY